MHSTPIFFSDLCTNDIFLEFKMSFVFFKAKLKISEMYKISQEYSYSTPIDLINGKELQCKWLDLINFMLEVTISV